MKGYLDELTDRAAKPVIAKYTGVLAAADVEVFTTTDVHDPAINAPGPRAQRTGPSLTSTYVALTTEDLKAVRR